MKSLDSYFLLDARIISTSPYGLNLAKEEHGILTTAVKILKILSFILLFPIF
ncbi:DUF648 domain-containing protein [Candidatus Chlamydia corallus]|uniref:DUF648 domain-containing protein n=1 Tax=Candidatus Chlamydia corallus TaxID=2038470 RepID=UPI001EFE519F|nr:DUF648 domain-containing protein [Candidatus Chlamydia corallus]